MQGASVTNPTLKRARAGEEDAEDLLHETLIAARRGLAAFEERAVCSERDPERPSSGYGLALVRDGRIAVFYTVLNGFTDRGLQL